jgi:hypothetical protein
VHFRSPKETEAIVPDLLKRVWEVDNDKRTVLHDMWQQGGVSGDCFVKVAYEEPGYYPPEPEPGVQQRYVPGKVRILPLQAAFCFPEWHPHDRTKLLRFKLKYRFWGTSLEGTRQVFTYTEILTDDSVEEYVNDELISQRPNPLGLIPVVHIANTIVSGSPWGLADCNDILTLNREYNEKATDIADIINYHAAPVTVITGAKASQLEKGVKKVWGGLPKDAKVENLEMPGNGINLAMTYLETIKRAMHEMIGVPETALGQVQPISNTSGVALSIQFQPLMNRWGQKIGQYGAGLERINELILRTLAQKEPQVMAWDATQGEVPPKPDQLNVLDPADPITYVTYAHFPPPLPIDRLIVLNEVQLMLALQLESREGALRQLGEEFPEEKLNEIRDELMDDAKADGALQLLSTEIQAEILNLTGMMAGQDGNAELPPTQSGGQEPGGRAQRKRRIGNSESDQVNPPQMPVPLSAARVLVDASAEGLRNDLVTRAYGTKAPQRRSPTES